MAGRRKRATVAEASEIGFLSQAYGLTFLHPSGVVNSAIVAGHLGVTAKHAENRLQPFVDFGDIKLRDGRYEFEGNVWLKAQETGEIHMLGTWFWLFMERA